MLSLTGKYVMSIRDGNDKFFLTNSTNNHDCHHHYIQIERLTCLIFCPLLQRENASPAVVDLCTLLPWRNTSKLVTSTNIVMYTALKCQFCCSELLRSRFKLYSLRFETKLRFRYFQKPQRMFGT